MLFEGVVKGQGDAFGGLKTGGAPLAWHRAAWWCRKGQSYRALCAWDIWSWSGTAVGLGRNGQPLSAVPPLLKHNPCKYVSYKQVLLVSKLTF